MYKCGATYNWLLCQIYLFSPFSRWLDYSNINKPVQGLPIIAFKTPLCQVFCFALAWYYVFIQYFCFVCILLSYSIRYWIMKQCTLEKTFLDIERITTQPWLFRETSRFLSQFKLYFNINGLKCSILRMHLMILKISRKAHREMFFNI